MGNPDYQRRGAPPTTLRLLGPSLVALTLVMLAGGVFAYTGTPACHLVADPRPVLRAGLHVAGFAVDTG